MAQPTLLSLVVLISSPCSGRMKLDSSVSIALLLHSESTAEAPGPQHHDLSINWLGGGSSRNPRHMRRQ